MISAIHASALAGSDSATIRNPDGLLQRARAAGFEGIEWVVADEELAPATVENQPGAGEAIGGDLDAHLSETSAWRRLRARAEAIGVRIVALSSAAFWQSNYASPDKADRDRAVQRTRRLLAAAECVGAGAITVVPGVVGRAGEARPRIRYEDALALAAEALAKLRFDAEARAVRIAIENVWNRFLLSPVEMAELLDRVGSHWVGACFDTGNVMAFGYPGDWIRTLGRRIASVHVKDYDLARPGREGFCPLGEGSVDWADVRGALHEIGFDGPLTYEGAGDPAEMCRRLGERLLSPSNPSGRGPTATGDDTGNETDRTR